MMDVQRVESENRRRRTCADRLRHQLAERQRQRLGGDPAGKVLLPLPRPALRRARAAAAAACLVLPFRKIAAGGRSSAVVGCAATIR